jgi:hypothetical protein
VVASGPGAVASGAGVTARSGTDVAAGSTGVPAGWPEPVGETAGGCAVCVLAAPCPPGSGVPAVGSVVGVPPTTAVALPSATVPPVALGTGVRP